MHNINYVAFLQHLWASSTAHGAQISHISTMVCIDGLNIPFSKFSKKLYPKVSIK